MNRLSIPELGLVLLVACLAAIVSRRLRLPYSVGLMLAGMGLALTPVGINLPLSRDLIFTVFLPPLVFEAAVQMKWKRFRRELPATLLLAFPGVILAAAIVAAGVHFWLGWSWIGAGLFGVLIAATDPVAVIAAFKETPVDARLRTIVQSESLLNDGVAAVGFAVLLSVLAGDSGGPMALGIAALWSIAGAVLTGGAVALLLLLLSGRTADHLVEITLTTLAAYGSFLLAERLGASGVLASLTAGLVMGNLGWTGYISEQGRGHVLAFWQYAAFLANSVVFILIGSHEAHQRLALFSGAAAVAVVLVIMARGLTVYPLAALLSGTRLRIPWRYRHVLFWGGLRGALALALALALPATVAERGEIVVAAFAVVAFSVLVQGLTMPWLIRRLMPTTSEDPAAD